MNEKNLNAMVLNSGLPSIAGQSGRIDGVLRVDIERSLLYLAGMSEEVLPIAENGFRTRLLDAAPCYVGGRYLYDDPVSLFVEAGTLAGEVVVVRVESGRLTRGDEAFDF